MLARSSPRRTRGGLELRKELDRATLEVFGRTSLPGSPMLPVVDAALEVLCGRTMVFRSRISVGVISDGSISGRGRLVDFSI